MPRFVPFRGLLYDESRLSAAGQSLADVIAPPYDVISPEERESLAARSAFNSVLVELPEGDAALGLDPYQNAHHLLEGWTGQGILLRGAEPAFYGYRMSFGDHLGNARQTVGVIGALAVSDPGQGGVLPHEETMPKPKGDRLYLLRATRTNLSPIWGLSLAGGLTRAVGPPAEPEATAEDREGVTHERWRITAADATAEISALVASAPVVIADGHHRYETAVAYRDERRLAGDRPGGAHELVMALVVELAEEQLAVRPIHRLLVGLPAGAEPAALLGGAFDVSALDEEPRRLPWAMDEHAALGLVTADGTWLLHPRPATNAAAGLDLDSSRLEVGLAALPPHEVAYEADLGRALDAVSAAKASAAVLLRPATVEAIAQTAWTGRRMPPKTTYFHPKPRTGMVMRPVYD